MVFVINMQQVKKPQGLAEMVLLYTELQTVKRTYFTYYINSFFHSFWFVPLVEMLSIFIIETQLSSHIPCHICETQYCENVT